MNPITFCRSFVWQHYRRLCIVLTLTTFSLLGVNGAESMASETSDYILEDTLVTATKTGETRLQETPLSITRLF